MSKISTNVKTLGVLIPLLLDDPLWELGRKLTKFSEKVLIPLLLDDPLWAQQALTLT